MNNISVLGNVEGFSGWSAWTQATFSLRRHCTLSICNFIKSIFHSSLTQGHSSLAAMCRDGVPCIPEGQVVPLSSEIRPPVAKTSMGVGRVEIVIYDASFVPEGAQKMHFFFQKRERLTNRAASWQQMRAGSGMSSSLPDMFTWHLPKMLWKGSLPLVMDWTTRPVRAFASAKTPWNRLYGEST